MRIYSSPILPWDRIRWLLYFAFFVRVRTGFFKIHPSNGWYFGMDILYVFIWNRLKYSNSFWIHLKSFEKKLNRMLLLQLLLLLLLFQLVSVSVSIYHLHFTLELISVLSIDLSKFSNNNRSTIISPLLTVA